MPRSGLVLMPAAMWLGCVGCGGRSGLTRIAGDGSVSLDGPVVIDVMNETFPPADALVPPDMEPEVPCRELFGGPFSTACDRCESGETCAQFFDSFGEYWKTICCALDITCSPGRCDAACDRRLCEPGLGRCACSLECGPVDPLAYVCCCS